MTEKELGEPLPDWARSIAHSHRISIMQQLITRDPKKRGNACIADIYYDIVQCKEIYTVVTDAANAMKLQRDELRELYELGPYILSAFPNPKTYQALREAGYLE